MIELTEAHLMALKNDSTKIVTGKATVWQAGKKQLDVMMKGVIVDAIRKDVMVTVMGGALLTDTTNLETGKATYRSIPIVMICYGKRDSSEQQIKEDHQKMLALVVDQQLSAQHSAVQMVSMQQNMDVRFFGLMGVSHIYDPAARMASVLSLGWTLTHESCVVCHTSEGKFTTHDAHEVAPYFETLDELGNIHEFNQDAREEWLDAATRELYRGMN